VGVEIFTTKWHFFSYLQPLLLDISEFDLQIFSINLLEILEIIFGKFFWHSFFFTPDQSQISL